MFPVSGAHPLPMARLFFRVLRTAALVAILVTVSTWAVFSFTHLVPEDIQGYVTGVLLGRVSPTLDRTPGELIRHARQRLAGHPKLEFVALPVLGVAQPLFERPVPPIEFPRFGKGQQLSIAPFVDTPDYLVGSVAALEDAFRKATAGQVIEIIPGTYRINKIMAPRNPGLAERRITLRSPLPGAVTIEVNTNEAIQVAQPYWTFENLRMIGICKNDEYCEHAFHIVGGAHHTVIRNNHIEDFSAHIKINGYRDKWPDEGIIEFNNLVNTRTRHTSRPVTPVDLVGAAKWLVADNYVANFIKGDPKSTAFGIFMKGAGYAGRVERNLIICSLAEISQPGTRVGISFGGGGSGPAYCRDHECKVEFTAGRAINNIVAHCNDVGIDVNRSASTFIAHNTLINTAGIDIREEGASALAFGNHLEGTARARKGGTLKLEMNEIGNMRNYFVDADRLNLNWKKQPDKIPSHPRVPGDICTQPRSDGTLPGALESMGPC